jgi:dienelactone hydrolase
VLSLAYFGEPGLPDELEGIRLEYFAAAARLLAAESARHGPVAVIGYSRGTESALLTAEFFPDLVRGIVVYAPSDAVNPAYPDLRGVAWTLGGAAVPRGPIPLTGIAGPVLAIAGADDLLWPAALSTRSILQALDRAGSPYPHQALVYPGAGHAVGTYPYVPRGIFYQDRLTSRTIEQGGTRPADAAARRDSWPRVLAMLHSLSRG